MVPFAKTRNAGPAAAAERNGRLNPAPRLMFCRLKNADPDGGNAERVAGAHAGRR